MLKSLEYHMLTLQCWSFSTFIFEAPNTLFCQVRAQQCPEMKEIYKSGVLWLKRLRPEFTLLSLFPPFLQISWDALGSLGFHGTYCRVQNEPAFSRSNTRGPKAEPRLSSRFIIPRLRGMVKDSCCKLHFCRVHFQITEFNSFESVGLW